MGQKGDKLTSEVTNTAEALVDELASLGDIAVKSSTYVPTTTTGEADFVVQIGADVRGDRSVLAQQAVCQRGVNKPGTKPGAGTSTWLAPVIG